MGSAVRQDFVDRFELRMARRLGRWSVEDGVNLSLVEAYVRFGAGLYDFGLVR